MHPTIFPYLGVTVTLHVSEDGYSHTYTCQVLPMQFSIHRIAWLTYPCVSITILGMLLYYCLTFL